MAHGSHRGVTVDTGETGWLDRGGQSGWREELDQGNVILRHPVNEILERSIVAGMYAVEGCL